MVTEGEKLNWLRIQIRSAMFIAIGFSVMGFVFLVRLLIEWDWTSYVAFVVGVVVGILFSIRHPVSPLRFAPLIRRESLKMAEEEATTYLMPYRKRFPRYYYWIANIPYLAGALIMLASTHYRAYEVYNAIHYFVPWLKFALVGFFSSASLCPGVFSTYVVYTWKKEKGENSQE